MPTDSSNPLDGIDPESVSPDDVDEAAVRAALDSSNPLVRQRGMMVCETLAAADVDAVEPFLDDVAALASADNAAVGLRAIAVLDAVAEDEPAALDGRVAGLAEAAASDLVDVQLTAATALGKLVVERPDLVGPYARRLVEAVRATELEPGIPDVGDVVDDRVTRQTIQEHEEGERRRRMSGRRTLVNVAVAVAETEPETAFDAVDDLAALLDDVDPGVAGAAVDALAELAAADPDVVAPVRDDIVDCLDHDRTFVRARAIRALGELGDDAVVPKLETVAETDDDEDVRELAADTVDFLAGAS
ncbi:MULTISPECIES: HEAT repeat domain-containing protein [Halorussus]|uniref:HEAT repeat domain-containing protein n=1 Tax=Halorussus TaxID=1070314 RepID=UPI00209D9A17|nr:HEAT repeat domain-containing protein [Halorussus vallis]USZ78368.1 HEAT repeat domain-containing protein [Halorussus vallis]